MSESTVLDYQLADGVATLTLNRPQALNALDVDLIAALREATARAEYDDAVRAVVIRGAGDHFMAGGDLRWFREQLHRSAAERQRLFEGLIGDVQASILSLKRMNKPVLASVHGAAAGFGLSLVLACDLALAADNAYFTLAYRHIGLSPDGGATWSLPRLVGPKKAAEIAFLGDRFGAEEAARLGLVNRVVPIVELADATAELARRLATGPRGAIARTKALLAQSFETSLVEQLADEQQAFAESAALPDFDEGLAAFFGKWPARFA